MKKIMELLQNMKAKNEKKDNKGFSLVELIIVIAIMAILVGIVGTQVIPYIDKSRHAKDVQVLSGLCTDAMTAYSSNAANLDASTTYTITITKTDSDISVSTGTGSDKLKASFTELNSVKNTKDLKLESNAGKKVDKVVITCTNGNPMIKVKAVTAGASGAADTDQFDEITSK
jgi:type IV pilus assembly protein PilA